MNTPRRRAKTGLKLKTVRGLSKASYASLQSELIMLLHQKERQEQEARNLYSRLNEINTSLGELNQQIDSVRKRSQALEAESANLGQLPGQRPGDIRANAGSPGETTANAGSDLYDF